MRTQSGKLENILVVNVNWLGDVIFSIPVFKTLRTQYPHARLICLAVPRVKELLQCVPEIDEIFVYDEKGKDRGIFGMIRLIKNLRKRKFDAVFLLHGSWTRAFVMFLAGIKIRVGCPGKKKGKFLTHQLDFVDEDTHKADFYLSILESYGLTIADRSSHLQVPYQAKDQIAKILKEEGILSDQRFVVVHTSGNWDLKRWPQKNWAQLIKMLSNNLKIKVIISEGPKELEWAKEIAGMSDVNPVILAGKTNLHQLIALLAKASLVISADSGPLHIASCVSKNIIGLYGPTVPLTTGPRGIAKTVIFHNDVGCNRASCYHLACPDNICMQAVTVQNVFDAAKEILS